MPFLAMFVALSLLFFYDYSIIYSPYIYIYFFIYAFYVNVFVVEGEGSFFFREKLSNARCCAV